MSTKKLAKQLKDDGNSYEDIAIGLNKAGHKTSARGLKFNSGSAWRILNAKSKVKRKTAVRVSKMPAFGDSVFIHGDKVTKIEKQVATGIFRPKTLI